jgi:tRNA threonylcarbamoyladenosine biosynthesis protein TsaB
MQSSSPPAEIPEPAALILAIDTCGPSGSVALGRFHDGHIQILGQIELEGRSYSATLVAAVADLLSQNNIELKNIAAIVAVNGPGSFTGVRVGLSAVKGLAEPAQIPVVAVSRLEVLANIAEHAIGKFDLEGGGGFNPRIEPPRSTRALASEERFLSSALDAHRHEVFLRLASPANELLAGPADLATIAPPPRIAVCDDAAASLLRAAWPTTELLCTPAPTATDALQLAAPRFAARQFVDLALLDGHYLRRSDAEIFGEPAASPRK